MKKWIVLICLLLSVAFLPSCGSEAPMIGPDDSRDSPSDVELTLWAFPVGNWGNPTAVGNILTGFHKEHPNIHISVEYLSYDNGDERVEQAVTNGSAPDLILEGPERLVANWGDRGWMMDLSDLWGSEKAGTIYEEVRDACQHKDGAYYEFPVCISAHCMAINRDMFQEADAFQYIDEETHTWTTEGFIQAVRALTDYGQEPAGVVYCNNQSGDQGTRALVNNLYGGTFTDDAHTVYTVDSAENRAALQLLYDLDGIVFDPSLTASDAIDLFCQKKTAMCFCWNASIEIKQTRSDPDLDFDVFPVAFPTNDDVPKLQGGIWGFGIFKNGSDERIEAAKTFIRYITENDAAYTRAVRTSSYWPVRNMDDIYENDMLMTEYSIFMSYLGDYYQIAPGWTQARTAWWQLLRKVGAGADIAEAVRDFPSPDLPGISGDLGAVRSTSGQAQR